MEGSPVNHSYPQDECRPTLCRHAGTRAAQACSTPTTHISCASRREACASGLQEKLLVLWRATQHVQLACKSLHFPISKCARNGSTAQGQLKALQNPYTTDLQTAFQTQAGTKEMNRLNTSTYTIQPLTALSQLIELCLPNNDEPSPSQC